MTGALFADRPFAPADNDGDHAPRPPRTNLLLSATLETAFGDAAVRVRNLSDGGAMIEGGELPQPGERLLLRRAALSVAGSCVWRSGARCGVRFDRPISVPHWAGTRTATSSGQQRVDALQAAIRAGGAAAPAAPPVTPAQPVVVRNVADEVAAAAAVLRALSDRLAEDMGVIAAHGDALQQLDPLAQTLDHLARILSAPDPGPVIAGIGMDDLRARLTRPRSR